jgi:D-alanine-D-alanine ligase
MGAATALDLIPEAVGGFPVAVKPAKQGSALGFRRVDSADELADALLSALSYDTSAIVERWVEGTELAVSVLGEGDEALVLPAVEIAPVGELYDFSARMTPGEADFFAPARITPDAAKAASDAACAVHTVLGCRDVSRVDLVLDAEGNPFVLECNTSPGMTETSLLPMAAEAADMTFQDVVSRLVEAALSRGRIG